MSEKSQSRSQRRFNNNLERAVEGHKRKLDKGKLSAPSQEGTLVITISDADDNKGIVNPEDVQKAFREEAEQLAAERAGDYNKVIVKTKATPMDLSMDLEDKHVSGLILIGHGNIGDFWTENGGHFSAFDVAKNVKYLKRGTIEQRICGHFRDSRSVPLGTFALMDQRDLIAPLGVQIDDIDPDESLFVPVYDQPRNSADDIRTLINTYYEELPEEDPEKYPEDYHEE